MAWNSASEIVIGGTGQVYVAAEGSTLPTTTTGAPAVAFVGLGYHTEEGLTLRSTPDVTDHRVWQSKQPARREINAQDIQVAFELVQWDEDSIPLAFGGGSISGSAPDFRYNFPTDDDALDIRALVADVQDGSTHLRFVFPRVNVVETVEATFNRTSMAGLPITCGVLAPEGGGSPGYILTDSAGLTAGS